MLKQAFIVTSEVSMFTAPRRLQETETTLDSLKSDFLRISMEPQNVEDVQFLLSWARFEKSRGNLNTVRKIYARIIDIAQEPVGLLIEWANFERVIHSLDDANRLFVRAARLTASRIHSSETTDLYRQASECSPNNANTFLEWALFEEWCGSIETARECYSRAETLEKRHLRQLVGFEARRSGVSQAHVMLKSRDSDLSLTEQNAPMTALAGSLKAKLGEVESGVAFLKTARTMAQESRNMDWITQCYLIYAETEAFLGNLYDARDIYQEALRSTDADHNQIVMIHYANFLAEQLAEFREAVEIRDAIINNPSLFDYEFLRLKDRLDNLLKNAKIIRCWKDVDQLLSVDLSLEVIAQRSHQFITITMDAVGIKGTEQHVSEPSFYGMRGDMEQFWRTGHEYKPISLFVLQKTNLRYDDTTILLQLIQEMHTELSIIFVPLRSQALVDARKNLERISIYGIDLVVIAHQELSALVEGQNLFDSLRRIILHQINLRVISPYRFGGAVQTDDMFKGRERELNEITSFAYERSFFIVGGRRIGKSSLIQKLKRTLPQKNYLVRQLSCQTTESYPEFLSQTAREILGTESASFDSIAEIFSRLDNKRPIVILLDEVDSLVHADEKNGWRLFRELKEISQNNKCQFVIAGERTLDEALSNDKGPLFNFGERYLIGLLEKDEVSELITHPISQLLQIEIRGSADMVNHIWDITSGHPMIVQNVCALLLSNLSRQERRYLSVDDVNDVTSSVEFQDMLRDAYLEQATCLEEIIALVLAQKPRGTFSLRSVKELINYEQRRFKFTKRDTDYSNVEPALKRLERLRSIVRRTESGYVLENNSIRQLVSRWDQDRFDDVLIPLLERFQKFGDVTFQEASKENKPT